jgi:uncharacterized protein YukE
MGLGSRAFLAGGLGFAASFVVACGGGNGLLTSNDANNLQSRLDRLGQAVAAGHCGAAGNAAQQFSDQVARLPSNVSPTLVQNLDQGAQTVQQLAAKDCRTASTSSSSSSTSSSTTTTSTTPTSTTTPSTSSSSSSSSSSATTPSGPGTSSTATNGGTGLGGGGGNGGTTPNGK